MLYPDDFVISLPADAEEAIMRVLNVIITRTPNREEIFEARDLLTTLMEVHQFTNRRPDIKLDSNNPAELDTSFRVLHAIISEDRQTRRTIEQKDRFASLLGSVFHYELSEADVQRIQHLLNELRDMISGASDFEADHKQRILKRLERLQSEIHKRLSDLDKFYGIIGDAGVLLGKFGRDAKPFIDRIREIVEIIWRAQANAEQLPTSARPALLSTDKTSEDEFHTGNS